MNQRAFLERFKRLLGDQRNFSSKADYILANYLYLCFTQISPMQDFMNILMPVPQLCDDFIGHLATANEPTIKKYRSAFLVETKWVYLPTISDPTPFDRNRDALVDKVATLIGKIVGEPQAALMFQRVKDYMLAGDTFLEQRFLRFVRIVYKTGLKEELATSPSQIFGSTRVRCRLNHGVVSLEFSRSTPRRGEKVQFRFNEANPLFIEYLGITELQGSAVTALHMMQEVEDHWRNRTRVLPIT